MGAADGLHDEEAALAQPSCTLGVNCQRQTRAVQRRERGAGCVAEQGKHGSVQVTSGYGGLPIPATLAHSTAKVHL